MVPVSRLSVNCDDTEVQIYYKARRAVTQVEVFMAAAAVLLFFQLVCGSLRRRSNNAFIHGGLWVSYTLLPPLVTYTLGLMQSSQVAVVIMYPVWALSLFLIAGGVNSITAYDLDDNRQWKRGLFDILQYDIYFCIILFQLLYPTGVVSNPSEEEVTAMSSLLFSVKHHLWHLTTLPVIILFIAVCIAHTFRTLASWMVNYSYPSKVVADYMKHYAASSSNGANNSGPLLPLQGGGDHSRDEFSVIMKRCKYMVHWPAYKVTGTWNGASSLYRCEPVPKEGVVTVGMVWDEIREEKFTSHGLSSSRVKGACLSYSLSHLLRRRFFGMDCAEATLPETRRFVLEGLLSDTNTNDEYTEAFRVIEVELAFLYDFFYTSTKDGKSCRHDQVCRKMSSSYDQVDEEAFPWRDKSFLRIRLVSAISWLFFSLPSLQLQVAPEAHFHLILLIWRMAVFGSQHSSGISWSCSERAPSTRLAHWTLASHLQEQVQSSKLPFGTEISSRVT